MIFFGFKNPEDLRGNSYFVLQSWGQKYLGQRIEELEEESELIQGVT